MRAVVDAVADRLMVSDESSIRIPEICEATGVNYGSVYHHFGSREGVIDAAYNVLFTQLVEDDIAMLRSIGETAVTIDGYVTSIRPIIAMMSTGAQRSEQRAIRVRIVAAALTRPELKELIGETQSRLTDEMVRIAEHGQNRGFLRRDISARSVAVLVQVLVFGRTLDDTSAEPINQEDWGHTMLMLFMALMNQS